VSVPNLLSAAAVLLLLLLQVIAIGQQDLPSPVKAIMRAPYVERMIAGEQRGDGNGKAVTACSCARAGCS
jgi:hypothetical protein